MLKRVGYLLLLLALCRGEAVAAAAPCEPGPYLKGVPFLAEQMTSSTAADGRVVYRHKEDPRIEVAFATTSSEAVSATTRLGFAAEISRRMAPEEAASRSRGGQMLVAAIPFSPAAYRVVRRGDPEIGSDLIAGRLVVYVSAGCELVATYAAPDAMVLRARFGEVVGAIDAVRDAVGRMAPSIQLRDENNAPRGGLAYMVGIGLPAVAAIILSFLLNRSVAKGRPGALSKAAMIFVAAASGMVMLGSAYAGFPPALPPEIGALILTVAASAVLTSFIPSGVPLRFAIAFGCAAGFAIVGYAVLGWVPEPYGIALAGACICLGSILAALWWTRATGRFMRPLR
jgi:hypothetical protein